MCKGFNSWFLYENGHFSNFFFLGKIDHENVFYDILEGKNTFQGYKNKKFKKSKNCYFSKGVIQWFWSKNGHYLNYFFLGNIGQGKVFYDMLDGKNAFLGYKNKKFKKLKNCHYFKRVNSWFWCKNGHFLKFFILVIIGQKNVFFDILKRENAFLGYKKRSSKSRKIAIFPKGLTHGFGPEVSIFSTSFFLGNMGQENVFYDILEQKNAFLEQKNNKFK